MALVGGQVGRTNKRRRLRLSLFFLSIGSFRGFERKNKIKEERGVVCVAVGAELVRVGERERGGGGKKATRSSRHQNGAVVCVFSIPRFIFFSDSTQFFSFSCFVLIFSRNSSTTY